MANRSERRSWDKYVSEAKETKSEWEFGDDTITVYIPSADSMQSFTETGDLWKQIGYLLGDENAEIVRKHAADAPVTALNAFIADVLADLGLDGESGESDAVAN